MLVAGHGDGDCSGGVCCLDGFDGFRRRLEGADNGKRLLSELLGHGVDKFVAVIGGGAERFCLALQKVQAREDGGLRTAAGDEIHVLQAAGFIKFLLELGNEFFDFHD